MTTSSHLTHAPASLKPTKAKQFAHPMPSPSVGNTAHGVGHHRPKAMVAAPMGGPRSPSRPPTCNACKNNIRGNKLSEATCFCELCMCGKGRGCGGGGLLACKGGAKIRQAVLPYRAYLPNSHLAGGNINMSEES